MSVQARTPLGGVVSRPLRIRFARGGFSTAAPYWSTHGRDLKYRLKYRGVFPCNMLGTVGERLPVFFPKAIKTHIQPYKSCVSRGPTCFGPSSYVAFLITGVLLFAFCSGFICFPLRKHYPSKHIARFAGYRDHRSTIQYATRASSIESVHYPCVFKK